MFKTLEISKELLKVRIQNIHEKPKKSPRRQNSQDKTRNSTLNQPMAMALRGREKELPETPGEGAESEFSPLDPPSAVFNSSLKA